MTLKIRLARGGSKRAPYYQMVVTDVRNPRDGSFIEKVGAWNPMTEKDDPTRVLLDTDRIRHWLSVGAQPTHRVQRFLADAQIMGQKIRNNPFKGVPGSRADERAMARISETSDQAAASA